MSTPSQFDADAAKARMAAEAAPARPQPVAAPLRQMSPTLAKAVAEVASATNTHATNEEMTAALQSDAPTVVKAPPSLREKYEALVEPASFDELFTSGKITQRVTILPKAKLVAEFRSLDGNDLVAHHEATELFATTDLGRGLYGTYARIALTLAMLGGRKFPAIALDKDTKRPSPVAINARVEELCAMPTPVLELLTVHMDWFLSRMDKLISDDFRSLGNG